MKGSIAKFEVHIRNSSRKPPIKIRAEMPNDINLSVQQDYESPFKIATNPTLQFIFQKFFNQAMIWDTSMLMTWMGSSPLQLTLDLDFVVDENVYDEVIDPFKQLMKLSVPARGGTFGNLRPPSTVNSPTSVSIGNILYLRDVLITAVAPVLSRPLLGDGYPMRIPFTVTMQTRFIPCASDIDEMFFSNRDALS